jgi:hypothetical protein
LSGIAPGSLRSKERLGQDAQDRYPSEAGLHSAGAGRRDCPDSRHGKGRIVALCNPCRNAEPGAGDKQDGTIILSEALMLHCRITDGGTRLLSQDTCRSRLAGDAIFRTPPWLEANRGQARSYKQSDKLELTGYEKKKNRNYLPPIPMTRYRCRNRCRNRNSVLPVSKFHCFFDYDNDNDNDSDNDNDNELRSCPITGRVSRYN